METVEMWWNGHWGRMARRNIWLKHNGTSWSVEAREGDSSRDPWTRDYGANEAAARALVAEMRARTDDKWRQLI